MKMNKNKLLLTITAILITLSSCGGGSSSSGVGTGTNPVGFSRLLADTFNHPRCQNCHAFETNNLTQQIHRDQGRLEGDCSTCHFTPGWEAPFQSFTFSDKTNVEICESIINKSGDDLQNVKKLMVESSLARWAIVDGGTLSGTLERAPPGSMAALADLIDTWIAGGGICD